MDTDPLNKASEMLGTLKKFLYFALLSGLGWLLDFSTFTVLLKFNVLDFIANFVSSYVGVTFVWFTSLRMVFSQSGKSRMTFLLIYWGFQFISISVYSQLLHMVASTFSDAGFLAKISNNPGVAAKIIVTPFNLVTNFLFMRYLTHFLRKDNSVHVEA